MFSNTLNEKIEKQNFFNVNQETFAELLTFIDFAEQFTLGFIEVNFPPEIPYVIEYLKDHEDCQNIQLEVIDCSDPSIRFLKDEIVKKINSIVINPQRKLMIIIRGLEQSIGVSGEYPPVLNDLNFVRDAYKMSVPHPLLFILPDYAITRIAKFAPDFWAWRSAVFRFKNVPTLKDNAVNLTLKAEQEIERIAIPKREERIDLLHRLLMEYHPSGEKIKPENLIPCIEVYNELGKAYLSLCKPRQAKPYLDKALAINQGDQNLKLKAITYYRLGNVIRELREWEKARGYYQQALEIFIEYGDRYLQASTYNCLGMVAQELREWEKARGYYQQALAIYFEYGDRYWQAGIYNCLGSVAQELREWEKARGYYQQALEIFIEYGDRYLQASTYNCLGSVAQELREWEKARSYYQQALEIYIEYGDRYLQASTYHQLGRLAEALGEIETAKKNYLQALSLWREFEDNYRIETFSLPSLKRLDEKLTPFNLS